MNINMIKNLVLQKLGNTTNPIFKSVLDMAQKNDVKGLENFARNIFKEQGRDFDSEIKQFMNNFK